MVDKPLDDLVEIIKENMDHIKFLSEQIGITDKSLNRMMVGEDVVDCPYYETFNLYEVSYNSKNNWSMYECGACEKSWYVDWTKDEDKFKLKKD